MHKTTISKHTVEKITKRCGRPHPFDVINPAKTALVVIDMQNHFVAPGFMAETPVARDITPNINRLADEVIHILSGRLRGIRPAASISLRVEFHKKFGILLPQCREIRVALAVEEITR